MLCLLPLSGSNVIIGICLLATSRKNTTALRENFTEDVSLDKDEPFKFCKSPAPGSLRTKR